MTRYDTDPHHTDPHLLDDEADFNEDEPAFTLSHCHDCGCFLGVLTKHLARRLYCDDCDDD